MDIKGIGAGLGNSRGWESVREGPPRSEVVDPRGGACRSDQKGPRWTESWGPSKEGLACSRGQLEGVWQKHSGSQSIKGSGVETEDPVRPSETLPLPCAPP